MKPKPKTLKIQGKTQRLTFQSHTGGSQSETITFDFGKEVQRVIGLAINGWNLQFDNKDDKKFGRASVNIEETNFSFSGSIVKGPVRILLRDWSGSVDDDYSGYVDVLCLAETIDR